MPTKKTSKSSSGKKAQVKVSDLKPKKDAKGGLARGVGHRLNRN